MGSWLLSSLKISAQNQDVVILLIWHGALGSCLQELGVLAGDIIPVFHGYDTSFGTAWGVLTLTAWLHQRLFEDVLECWYGELTGVGSYCAFRLSG
jgi:hypothetical protein